MMSQDSRKHVGWILLICTAGFLGCGASAPKAEVVGTITFNGKTPDILGLTLTFLGPDGQPVGVGVNKDGSFKGQGISVGENKVSLRLAAGDAGEDNERSKSRKSAPAKADPLEQAAKAAGISVPKKLQDPLTSGKTLMVEAGKENTMTWDVK